MQIPKMPHGSNFFDSDHNLQQLMQRLQPDQFKRWAGHLSDFGAWVGGALDDEAGYTDRHGRPRLETYGRDGEIINQVILNPAWNAASREIYRRGIVGLNYLAEPASFLTTFAMGYLTSQADVSLHCPATMTGAVAHVLNRFAPEPVREPYLQSLTRMDGEALSAGTWATELHGGSDVGATTTSARRNGDHFLLNGLKWFTSNINGGIAIATARPDDTVAGSDGLGLYLVPWQRPDGSPNAMRLRRLKDKLGTCGVATAEVDLMDSYAVKIAPPPDGFKLMMAAIEFSRIHNAMSAVGLQRRALMEALCFAAHRQAFGDFIIRYPMIQDELLSMQVALEADMALAFEAAQSFDEIWSDDAGKTAQLHKTWLRLATALAKYQTAENANRTCRAAIELIGGNGYTYDFVTPRLLRDAQVLTVWEGPSNIQALEILRLLDARHGGFGLYCQRIKVLTRELPPDLATPAGQLQEALGQCREAAALIASNQQEAQRHARRLMSFMAQILAAALLLHEAAQDAAHGTAQQQPRKAFIARHYIEQTLSQPQRRGMTREAGWVYDEFETMVLRANAFS